MCGIIGIFSTEPVVDELYDGLIHLQHRGQDAAGILTYNERFHLQKGTGYVRDVFNQENIALLKGNMGIGHVRYPTAGTRSGVENAQPFIISAPYGIAMCHNGDVVNYQALKKELENKDRRYCGSSSDIEVILHVFAAELEKLPEGDMFKNICKAVNKVFERAIGAYSVLGVIAGKGIFAFRDPHGIRPLVMGTRKNQRGGTDYIFSSENTMYYPLGFQFDRDVAPGEVVFINMNGEKFARRLKVESFTPCVFEYVYLARPDSTINDISVYRARLRLGQNLGRRWKEKYPDIIPDVVVPVPFSSNTAALSMAHELGVRYSEGLYKNPFIGRTFIMPGQKQRRKSVLQKLSPQETEIRNKNVLLVDDSIVRGTTSREVIKLVRDAGAKKIYFASSCPPIKYPDFYGIDMHTRAELIGAHMSEEEIREFIGADILLYQTIPDLEEAILRRGEHNIDRLSMPYLDGWYVTGDISVEKIEKTEKDFAFQPDLLNLTTTKNSKVLLVGSGAREHALARSLKKSATKIDLICFASSNNPGIMELASEYIVGKLDDVVAITNWAQKNKVDWAIIGPELPLAAGVVDELAKINIPAVGPIKLLAQLETSKSFTRALCAEYDIPGGAKFKEFSSTDGVEDYLNKLNNNYVVKADGLMGGKGVKVFGEHLKNTQETLGYCSELISAGSKFIIEEKFVGQEFSLMSFCDGENLFHLPAIQDHKRALEGDIGPNTGGMGSYSCPNGSLPFLTENDIKSAQAINIATASAIKKKFNTPYKGVLYGGFMATADGVKLIEYNARLGDPEAMNVLAVLETDFVELCENLIKGTLDKVIPKFSQMATVVKYAVPEGYPDNPIKNQRIDVSLLRNKDNLFFAAVDKKADGLYELGSRTLAILAKAETVEIAQAHVEAEMDRLIGPLYHRADIGTAKLIENRVTMMKELRK